MIHGGRDMKKIIIKDDDRVVGKWRIENYSDFEPTFKELKIKHDKIEVKE